MALVNPNIAMSYRPTVEYQPRNALAEAAQLQQIMGAQTQQEAARMQLDKLRREEAAIETMMQAITAKDGPSDPWVASDAMIKSKVPQYMDMGFKMQESLRQTDRDRVTMGLPPLYGRPSAAPSAAPTSAAGAITGKTPTFPIAGKDVRMGTLGTGTFDSARISDIGLAQPGLSRMSAADKAEMAASAGLGGIQSMRMPQGPYTGLTLEQNRAYFQAPPEERAALERALPSMKIPGVSAGQVPAFSQLSRDLLSPETRAAQDLGYGPAAQANALAPTAPPENVNQLAAAGGAAAGGAAAAAMSPEERRAREMLLSSNAGVREAGKAELAKLTASHVISPGGTLVVGNKPVFTAPAAPTTPRVEIIGVAKGTDTPVYVDKNTDAQFKIGVDASGKQVRVPYTGAVNRSTSSVTVTGSRLESAEQKGQGELNIKSFAEIRDAARLAARTLPALETQAKILDQGFTTGFGTEVKTAGASLLAALGVPEAEKFATDAQTFLAATQQAVLQKQLEQKGTQTKADADRITQTGAQFGNTVKGNRFIIDVAREQLRRDIEQRDFYSNWWNNKKTYEGAEDAWYASEGGKSLFDRPALKKYLAPAQGAAAAGAAPAIPQAAINDLKAGRGTDAQFDAIFGAGAAKRAREGK
jgi:hypothetical protein